jgi:hypothetical protein
MAVIITGQLLAEQVQIVSIAEANSWSRKI